MRIVLDTNIVISALLWRGTPYQLLAGIRQRDAVQIYTSAALLEELVDVLGRPAAAKRLAIIGKTASELFADYVAAVEVIEPPPLPQPVCRDPDDDHLLALALAAQAEAIVSGDHDLLVLRQFQGVPILEPEQALQQLPASTEPPTKTS